ncbi:MAG: AMP-binding protein [bacterium]
MLLINYLKTNAKKFPNRTALTMRMGYRTVSLTYYDVYLYAQKTATFLQRHGIKKGDIILLLAPNSPYWVCIYWACLLCGAIVVPLNIQSTAAMVKRIAEQTEPKLFFSYIFFKPTIDNVPTYNIELLPELIKNIDALSFKEPTINQDDLIQILYTSGTTGDPKGVMLNHKNLATNMQTLMELIPLHGHKERLLSILPLSHILEQTIGFLIPYALGAHIIYAHSYSAIKELLQTYHITRMVAVPEFLKVFMDNIEMQAKQAGKLWILEKMRNFSLGIGNQYIARLLFRRVLKQFGGKLKTIICGGAPLDSTLEITWEAFGIEIMQGYGLTETSPVISTNSYDHHHMGSVGKIIPGLDVKLDTDGNLLVKGPSVFQGYFKNQEKTHAAFTPDGYFKTDDIGEFDAEGFLYLKGRKKYMILGSGGQNVHPEDLEHELNQIQGVQDSCVVGLEKSGGHVEIHAVLLCKGSCNGQNIIDQANKHLASYQQIASGTLWPEQDFPRSATRKIKKHEVIEWLKHHKGQQATQTKTTSTPLVRILAQLTGTDAALIIKKTKLVSELGLDSLLRIELIMRIEQEFNVAIDEAKITTNTTLADLETLIVQHQPITPTPPLKRWPRFTIVAALRLLFQSFLFLISRIFCTLRINGIQHVKALSGPVIFMPNHISYFDPFVVVKAMPFKQRYKLAFAAARDVLYKEFKFYAFPAELLFNAFPFPRTEHENLKQGLEYMGQLIDQGHSIVLFPEGKVSQTGKLLPLKRGAGLVAIEMMVPVIPVKIEGAEKIFPYDTKFPRRYGTVSITFGKALTFSRKDSYLDATKKIEAALKTL